jgi:RNA polymerase sigma-70 factor (ECF subfamily)
VADTPRTEEALVDLMRRYQDGDLEAFEQIYETLAAPLGRYLRGLSRNAARAEDLLQETFLQIHRARASYTPPRPVKPWVYAIARHVFLMSRRAATRRAKREMTAIEELPEVPIPPDVASLADRDQVHRALEKVSDDHREALTLHHLGGLSFKEIGHVLGISEGAAKVRAHRGMAKLREVLGASETAR